MNQNYDQQYDEEDDDLCFFNQENRIQQLKAVGVNFIGQSQKDQIFKLNEFFKQQNTQIQELTNKFKTATKKIQINQEDLTAKKLRLHNAVKYFELLKLTYIKHVTQSIKFVTQFNSQSQRHMKLGVILSLFSFKLMVSYHQFKNTNPFSIKVQKILSLLENIFKIIKKHQNLQVLKNIGVNVEQALWIICRSLKVQIRKVCFFDLSQHVDQSFYNLNYDKNKKKAKKVTKAVDQIRNKIQRKIDQQTLINQKNDFVNLEDFSLTSVTQSFNKKADKNHGQFKILKSREILNRTQGIRKNFKKSTFQIFSYIQNKWVMFFCHQQSEFKQVEIDWLKQNILNGQPIVGFYSVEQLQIRPKYEALIHLRKMGKIVIRDLSIYFGDKLKSLAQRRQRVGIRIIMNKIFRHCKFLQPMQILTQECSYVFNKSKELDQQLLKNQIPMSISELNTNDYFIIPSKVGKYFAIQPDAKPALQNFQIDEQKIYWKDDLLPIGSRMSWIDFGRMVKQNQIPLKKTQNRNKKAIQLYRYEQTQPFQLKIDEQKNFVLDPEHFSIYVPPNYNFPKDTCIIKKNIGFICNKYKFKHAKIVQGFVNTGMRVLPNQIGYLVYEKDRQDILKYHQQRQAILNKNKQTRQGQNIQKMWKELFKSLKLMDRLSL